MSPEPTPTAEHLAKVEAEQAALRRIAAFGGTMTLDSPTGKGTTLVAQFPLPEPVPVT